MSATNYSKSEPKRNREWGSWALIHSIKVSFKNLILNFMTFNGPIISILKVFFSTSLNKPENTFYRPSKTRP